jgi:hypothetical protein
MVKPELHSGRYQGIAGSFEKDDVSTGRHIGTNEESIMSAKPRRSWYNIN